ncbi:MAG TPA: DUF3616 domain-containing protein [Pyrinomonadaceae bacterium]|jgi:hypothetical protein
MKRVVGLVSIVLTFIACVGVTENASLNESINVKQFNLEEISAATMLPGNRLLLASDEGKILLLEGAAERLKNNDFKPDSFKPITQAGLDDIEDIALTTDSEVYFITSHSRSRRGKNPDKRYKIAVLQLDGDGKPKEPIALESLKLKGLLSTTLKIAMERTPAQSGFNIEGAAWNNQGQLLLGLRSPTLTVENIERQNKLYEDAIVLRIKNPKALFSSEQLQIEEQALDLEGKGIRAMHYDLERKGSWIITGLSPDPNYDVQNDWALWFWDEKNPPKKMTELGDAKKISYPEAICRVMIGNTAHLLIIEDSKESRFAIIPVPNS